VTLIRIICRTHGFPDDLMTYGLISGVWTSMFALGAFVGPSLSGILFDYVGFRIGTLFVLGLQLLLVRE
jgi:MFS family permease